MADIIDGGRPFTRIQVVELDDAAMMRLLRQTGRLPPGEEARLMQVLRARPALLSIARNPLLLTVIAYVYATTGTGISGPLPLPTSRARFYRDTIQLLVRRDQESGISRRAPYFAAAEQQAVLTDLALALMDGSLGRDKVTFDYGMATEFLYEWLQRRGHAGPADSLLQVLVERSQLLVPHDRDPARYQFRHLTFRDALVALRLRDDSSALLARFRAVPDEWRDVVLLWSGISEAAQVTQVVAELAGSGEQAERLLAFQCLTESESIDGIVAGQLIKEFEATLGFPAPDPRVVTALGMIAGQERYGGQALLTRLSTAAVGPAGSLRTSAQHALAVTNRRDAAELLAGLLDSDPGARTPLRAMGQVAMFALAARAQKGSVPSIDIIASIATPDAIGTLVDLLGGPKPVAERAAWRLAELTADDAVLDVVRRSRLNPSAHAMAREYLWVLTPFTARGGGPKAELLGSGDEQDALSMVMAYVAAVLDQGAEDVPADIVSINWQVALPIAVIASATGAARRVSWAERLFKFLHPLGMLLWFFRASSRRFPLNLSGLNDSATSLPVRQELANRLAKRVGPRPAKILSMLPSRLVEAASRELFDKGISGPLGREQWVGARQQPKIPLLGATVLLVSALIIAVGIIGIGGVRLVGAFFISFRYGPPWLSWVAVGALAILAICVLLVSAGFATLGGLIAGLVAVVALVLVIDAVTMIVGGLGLLAGLIVVCVTPILLIAMLSRVAHQTIGFAREQPNLMRKLIAIGEGQTPTRLSWS